MQCSPVWDARWSKCSPCVWVGLLQTKGFVWFKNGWSSLFGVLLLVVGSEGDGSIMDNGR